MLKIILAISPNEALINSITDCGSLLTEGGDNDVARLTKNVLDRFSDPGAKFEVPASAP